MLVKLLVRVLPTSLAVRLIGRFARRSQRPQVTDEQREALAAATRVHYGGDSTKLAWCWGAGPLVLLVHGWNGRAAQLAPLAQRIAWEGFRCVCIDVTAHGESLGSRPSWRHFIDDVTEATACFGEVYACIGHSAGGLAMIAARARNALHAERFVCICAPSHPYPAIRVIQKLLDPPVRVLKGCRADIAGQFAMTWEQLEDGAVWKNVGAPLLLFYDRNDRYVDHTEGDRIKQWSRTARLEKSVGHGHTRVLAADELERVVVPFLERSKLIRAAVGSRRSVNENARVFAGKNMMEPEFSDE